MVVSGQCCAPFTTDVNYLQMYPFLTLRPHRTLHTNIFMILNCIFYLIYIYIYFPILISVPTWAYCPFVIIPVSTQVINSPLQTNPTREIPGNHLEWSSQTTTLGKRPRSPSQVDAPGRHLGQPSLAVTPGDQFRRAS